jgi:hypothetical protein
VPAPNHTFRGSASRSGHRGFAPFGWRSSDQTEPTRNRTAEPAIRPTHRRRLTGLRDQRRLARARRWRVSDRRGRQRPPTLPVQTFVRAPDRAQLCVKAGVSVKCVGNSTGVCLITAASSCRLTLSARRGFARRCVRSVSSSTNRRYTTTRASYGQHIRVAAACAVRHGSLGGWVEHPAVVAQHRAGSDAANAGLTAARSSNQSRTARSVKP